MSGKRHKFYKNDQTKAFLTCAVIILLVLGFVLTEIRKWINQNWPYLILGLIVLIFVLVFIYHEKIKKFFKSVRETVEDKLNWIKSSLRKGG
jgi:uncharacterized membrane protein